MVEGEVEGFDVVCVVVVRKVRNAKFEVGEKIAVIFSNLILDGGFTLKHPNEIPRELGEEINVVYGFGRPEFTPWSGFKLVTMDNKRVYCHLVVDGDGIYHSHRCS
jgi:hypothetical protein